MQLIADRVQVQIVELLETVDADQVQLPRFGSFNGVDDGLQMLQIMLRLGQRQTVVARGTINVNLQAINRAVDPLNCNLIVVLRALNRESVDFADGIRGLVVAIDGDVDLILRNVNFDGIVLSIVGRITGVNNDCTGHCTAVEHAAGFQSSQTKFGPEFTAPLLIATLTTRVCRNSASPFGDFHDSIPTQRRCKICLTCISLSIKSGFDRNNAVQNGQ